MSQDIFQRIKEKKEKFHKKLNDELRDRVRYESRDTFRVIDRLRSKGMTDKEIMRDIERSQQKNNRNYD